MELAHVGPQVEAVGPHERAVGTLFLLSAKLVVGTVVVGRRIHIRRGFPLLVIIRVG